MSSPYPFRQTGVARENVKARLKPCIEETAQTETQSAGSPGAGFRCCVQVQVPSDHLGQLAETFFRMRKIFGTQSLLRAVNPAGASRAEQRVLDINRHEEFG